jgi:hypothetical protein
MKKALSFLAAFIMLGAYAPGALAFDFSATSPSGHTLYYTFRDDSTLSVSANWNNCSGNLIIPDTVRYNSIVYQVSEIAANAFSGDTTIISVVIPSSIQTIERTPFNNCTNLKEVYYYAICPTIYGGSYMGTFAGCNSLENVFVGDSVYWIPSYMFDQCSNLKYINIPSSLQAVGRDAFFQCVGMRKVNFRGTIANWLSIDFLNDAAQPLFYADSLVIGDSLVTEVVLNDNDTIIRIGEYAFSAYGRLVKVRLNNRIKIIGTAAFAGNFSLRDFTSSDSLIKIGERAFNACPITCFTIPASVTEIGARAFHNCRHLDTIYFNAIECTTIDAQYRRVFEGCDSLTSIIIGEEVHNIPDYLFSGCQSVNSITLPSSVLSIGEESFSNCTAITQIYCHGTTPPQIRYTTFQAIPTNIPISVPCGAASIYHNAPYWNVFQNIVEDCNGIDNVDNTEIDIKTLNGRIIVEGTTDELQIFDMTGRIVRNEALQVGVYLVKVGTLPTKKLVVVR